MKQGHVEVCIIKCLLLGTAGVGKTCLLHLLLDMLPPPLRQSTACIEQAIRAICMKCSIDIAGKWQKVDSDGLCGLLAGSVSKEAISIRHSTDPPPASGALPPHDHKGSALHDRKRTIPHDHEEAALQDHEGATASTGPVSNTMDAIFKRLEEEPGLGKLQDMTWVYLVDSGGQPQFHELLTAFVQNASVVIFVHKLSERLDEHPHVKFFDEQGEQCGKGHPSALSNRDIFQHCIQTVQSLPYTTGESICPQLAVVGTHRDEEHQCEGESSGDKNKQLLEILHPISDNVIFRTGLNDVIYPVNAKSPDPEDKDTANKLREKIEKSKSPARELPLKWYGLELELEKEAVERTRWVFTMDECLQVAKRLHFPSEKALVAALIHLDKLNIFLYYPKVLPELLFCSPCVLLDKISELVEQSHRMKHGPDRNAMIDGKLSKFCKKGHVSSQLLGDYPKHYTEFFTPAHLLKLFESLLIVAPIDCDVYFMPSVLDMLKRSEFCRSSRYPLVIVFKGGCAPLGLFSSLVAFLLSDKNKPSPWVIAVESPKLHRNHITFGLSRYPGSVTLIDYAAFFEVHVAIGCRQQRYKSTCRHVHHAIERGLEAAIKARNFRNVNYEKAIPCPCKEHQHTLHPALFCTDFDGTPSWQCTLRSEEYGALEDLDDSHLATVWMENHTDTRAGKPHAC